MNFTKEHFLQDTQRFSSACDLANHWEKLYPITARGFDEDFIWMAAIVLWERLALQVINSEMLDELMQEGYDLLREDPVEACNLWLEVWGHLKKRFKPDMKSIEDAEGVFSGSQCLFNWCQDLEMELANAGFRDVTFFQKRIEYCREFCSLFPQTSALTIKNMRRAEAESYFALGEIEKGEEAFEKILQDYPDWAWGYAGWRDLYCQMRINEDVPLDYEKAEKIYRMALEKEVDEEEVILDRLEDLKREKNKLKLSGLKIGNSVVVKPGIL